MCVFCFSILNISSYVKFLVASDLTQNCIKGRENLARNVEIGSFIRNYKGFCKSLSVLNTLAIFFKYLRIYILTSSSYKRFVCAMEGTFCRRSYVVICHMLRQSPNIQVWNVSKQRSCFDKKSMAQ